MISRGFEDISTAHSSSFLNAASVSIDSFARRISAKAMKKRNAEPEDDDDDDNMLDTAYNSKALKAKYKLLKLETKKRIRKVSSSTTTSRKSSGGSVFSPRGSYSTYEDFFKMPLRQNSRETGNEESRIRLREAVREREREKERDRERGRMKENARKNEKAKNDEIEREKKLKREREKRISDTQRSPTQDQDLLERTPSLSIFIEDLNNILGQSVNSSVSQSLNESGTKPLFALRIRKGFGLPIRRTWTFFSRISLVAEVSDPVISEAGELHWQASYSASKPLKGMSSGCCLVC